MVTVFYLPKLDGGGVRGTWEGGAPKVGGGVGEAWTQA